jgi:hypothetical protein
MNKYCSFDVDGFFRDYNANKERRKFLLQKLDSIIDATFANPDEPKVSGGLPSSVVESKVERREKIVEKIAMYDKYFETVDEILNALEGEDRVIAEEYFLKGKKQRYQVDILADRIHCSRATCYRKIKEVRQKIKEYKREEGA